MIQGLLTMTHHHLVARSLAKLHSPRNSFYNSFSPLNLIPSARNCNSSISNRYFSSFHSIKSSEKDLFSTQKSLKKNVLSLNRVQTPNLFNARSMDAQHQGERFSIMAKTPDSERERWKFQNAIFSALALFGMITIIVVYNKGSDASSVYADKNVDDLRPFHDIRSEPPIYRICLTGGPSSGKTSSMTYLRDKLSALGFQVFVVTEIATLLLSGGATYRPDMDIDELLAFESALMKNQMAVEDNYIEIAKASKKPTVILCDRGILDAKAYMSQEIFEAILDMHGWNETKLREGRYDAIIHMVTAAIGAEKFYTRENNPSRMETAEEAAALDQIIRHSYIGHPNYTIIDNSTNFEGKVERVYSYVGSIVGLPKSISKKKKYLLKRNIGVEEFPPFLKYEIHEMTQGFLKERDSNAQTRIRKRSQKGTHTYSMSTKRVSSDGKEETVSVRPITAKSYYELSETLDPSLPPIKKVIKSFVYGECYFELATYNLFDDESKNPVILQVEAPEEKIELPSFLSAQIEKDVTPERETEDFYGSYYFSMQKRKSQL